MLSLHFAVAFAGASALAVVVLVACGGTLDLGDGSGEGAGALRALGAAAAFPSVAAPNHVFTPPCREHAPCSVFAVENVSSLHCAVALLGAFAGVLVVVVVRGAALGFEESLAVALGVGAVRVLGAAACVEAFASANHVLTPPCFEHAPCLVFAVE